MVEGPGVEIEMDETVLVCRKYQHDRIVKTVWLLGRVERLSKKGSIVD